MAAHALGPDVDHAEVDVVGPDAPCPDDGCPLRTTRAGGALCHLAHRLRRIPLRAGEDVPVDRGDPVARYRDTVADAVDLVRTCRLIEHPTGACWLPDAEGRPACGELLLLAHRVAQRHDG